MEVTIQVPGTFHAFRLAEQLEKKGYLKKIITTNPHLVIEKYREENVDFNKIDSIPLRVIREGLNRIPKINQMNYNFYLNRIFESLASKKIDYPDIFVGWSGSSFKSIKKANEQGAITIVERGSSHIEFQKEILEEEYAKFGMQKEVVDKRVVNKELKEYDEADYISTPSEFVKKSFIEKGVNEKKIIKTPYGANLDHLRYNESFNYENPNILFFGGKPIRKGLIYLLRAWNELKYKNSNLIIKTILNKKVNELFKIYNSDKISFISDYIEDINELYHRADIFVLPSLEDGFGMVIPEAMACGLPVITSKNTGGEDIIEDGKNGFVIPIRDKEAIKEKIQYFYKNPKEMDKMSKNARETAEKFTWDRYGEKILKKYENILDK